MNPTIESKQQVRRQSHRGLIITLVVISFVLAIVASIAITILMTRDKDSSATKSQSESTNEQLNSSSSSNSLTDTAKRARTSSSRANATTVQKKAEAYNALTGDYPKQISNFSEWEESMINTDIKVSDIQPTENTYDSVQYKYCSTGIAQVSYYDSSADAIVKLALSTATASESQAC